MPRLTPHKPPLPRQSYIDKRCTDLSLYSWWWRVSKSSITAFVTQPQSLSFDLPTVHHHDFRRALVGHNRKMGKAASYNRKGGGGGGGGSGGGGGRYFDHGGGGGGGSGGGSKRYVRTL